MPTISLAAEKIFSISGFPVSNSLLGTWLVMLIIIGLSVYFSKRISLVPSHGQSIIEMVIGGIYDFFSSVVGSHHIDKVFPLAGSLFVFIILANWIGLLPGFGTIGVYEKDESPHESVVERQVPAEKVAFEAGAVVEHEAPAPVSNKKITDKLETKIETKVEEKAAAHVGEKLVPIFRGPTADLNMTLALAAVAVIAIQFFGVQTLGFHYAKRFFNFTNPIALFVGLLEIISDISKVISFAFRLFGNIFAGEVLLTVIAFLIPFFAPLPFLVLELFVGFIQALVFSTLTAAFINVAVSHEG